MANTKHFVGETITCQQQLLWGKQTVTSKIIFIAKQGNWAELENGMTIRLV